MEEMQISGAIKNRIIQQVPGLINYQTPTPCYFLSKILKLVLEYKC